MTSVYCVIISVTHGVDWDQVLPRTHLSEVVNLELTGKVTAQFL